MKKLLSILLLFVTFGAVAQTYDTLPTGSKPYGNFYLGPDGNLVFGNAGLKFRVIGTKKRVDSLLALKADLSQLALYQTKTLLQQDLTPTASGYPSVNAVIGGLNTKANSADLASYQAKSEKGQSNGYAGLDGSGKVPLTQINDALLGAVNYRGTYNAATNSPALPAAANSNKGYYYIVSTAGTQFGLEFRVGDWIISNGAAYGKVASSSDVESVNGKKGVIALGLNDILSQSFTSELPISVGAVAAGSASVTSAPTQPTHVLRLDDVAAGKTIGANTTGSASSAALASDAAKLNGQTLDLAAPSTSLTWLLGKSSSGNTLNIFEPAPVKTWLGLGNGSTLNNSISGAALTSTRLASTTHNDTYYLYNEWDGANWFLRSNHPNAVRVGKADDATTWNGVQADWSNVSAPEPYDMLSIRLDGKVGRTPAANARAWLGLPTGGETLQTVTDRGNTTSNFLFTSNGSLDQGVVLDSYGVQSTNASNNAPKNLTLQRFGGNVGLGTTNPLAKLHVTGNILATNDIEVQNAAFWTRNSTLDLGTRIDANTLQSANYSNGATRPFIINPSGGSVGIGTTTPGSTLDVTGSARVSTNDGSSNAVARNVDLQGKANLSGGNSFLGNGVQNFINAGNTQQTTISPGTISNTSGTYYAALSTTSLGISSGTNTTTYNNGFINSNVTGSALSFDLPTVSGRLLTGFKSIVTLDFPNTAASQNSVLSRNVLNVAVNDVVTIALPNSIMSNMTNWNGNFKAWVSAANTVSFMFQNLDPAAAHDLAETSFTIFVQKQ